MKKVGDTITEVMKGITKENSNDNVFLLTETAVLSKSNTENGLGVYHTALN